MEKQNLSFWDSSEDRTGRGGRGFPLEADKPARKVPVSKVHHSMHTMNRLGMARRVYKLHSWKHSRVQPGKQVGKQQGTVEWP
jgi:hypothetical protein